LPGLWIKKSNLFLAQISNLGIPFLSLVILKQIVEKIEAERALVESAKKLIEIYKQKTKGKIATMWGAGENI
jgi:restriction endonuclease S subunit